MQFEATDPIEPTTTMLNVRVVNIPIAIMETTPGGSFKMGDETWVDANNNGVFDDGESGSGGSDELPIHDVTIAPFAMGKYEVTFEEYDQYLQSKGIDTSNINGASDEGNDNDWGRGKRPVVEVSWDEFQGYLSWLNTQLDIPLDDPKRYRLPSEAEWEYAARAGTTTTYNTGDCINPDLANYRSTSNYTYTKSDGVTSVTCDVTGINRAQTVEVNDNSFIGNNFGLFHMHGNVWEWVEDCWHSSYAGAPGNGTPWLDLDGGDCSRRVLRGGSWGSDPSFQRSAYRNRYFPFSRSIANGFRLSRTLN